MSLHIVHLCLCVYVGMVVVCERVCTHMHNIFITLSTLKHIAPFVFHLKIGKSICAVRVGFLLKHAVCVQNASPVHQYDAVFSFHSLPPSLLTSPEIPAYLEVCTFHHHHHYHSHTHTHTHTPSTQCHG